MPLCSGLNIVHNSLCLLLSALETWYMQWQFCLSSPLSVCHTYILCQKHNFYRSSSHNVLFFGPLNRGLDIKITMSCYVPCFEEGLVRWWTCSLHSCLTLALSAAVCSGYRSPTSSWQHWRQISHNLWPVTAMCGFKSCIWDDGMSKC